MDRTDGNGRGAGWLLETLADARKLGGLVLEEVHNRGDDEGRFEEWTEEDWEKARLWEREILDGLRCVIANLLEGEDVAYCRQVLEAAESNHIWISAFACINPSDAMCQRVGRTVLEWLNDRKRMAVRWTESAIEPLLRIGQLSPQLVVRINKS